MTRVLFSGNDPGGANAIVPVIDLLRKKGVEVEGILTGPARDVFNSWRIPFFDATDTSDDSLFREIEMMHPNVFLFGTSSENTIEKRVFPRLRHIPSVAVLDFWSNYWQRFSHSEEKDFAYLPNIVCVIDEAARLGMLSEGFFDKNIVVTGNPHFDHFTRGITREAEHARDILFISEYISEGFKKAGVVPHGLNEFYALEGVLRAVANSKQPYTVKIRLHPKDNPHKYDSYLNAFVLLSAEPTLESALSKAGLVTGMRSQVLMQAAAAGKPTISYQPGLDGMDILPTNKYGITHRVNDEKELEVLIRAYDSGTFPTETVSFESLWPQGATERVVDVVTRLAVGDT